MGRRTAALLFVVFQEPGRYVRWYKPHGNKHRGDFVDENMMKDQHRPIIALYPKELGAEPDA